MSHEDTSTFTISSFGFLYRALEKLEEYETEKDPSLLLYAALNLRYSIEARLYEYVDSTSSQYGIPNPLKGKEYQATKILKISYKTLLYKISDLNIKPPPNVGGKI